MTNEKSIVLSDNKRPVKQANYELFSYEMTQVILMLKGEFSSEHADSIINPNLSLPQTPITCDIIDPTPKVIIPKEFIRIPSVKNVLKPRITVSVPTDFASAPDTIEISEPTLKVSVPKDFVSAPSMKDILKPRATVSIPTDFASAPEVTNISKSTVEMSVSMKFASAPKKFKIIYNKIFVYIPNTSSFDFWKDWSNSTVSKVFAKSGIIIQED